MGFSIPLIHRPVLYFDLNILFVHLPICPPSHFSAVGSEFVEMFAGVAAARVNNLFMTARRRSPAIIFIDEIDAIGRARSALGGDPGSMERESALLAMLVQMDGIHGKLEQVLTIGATNLAQDLDQALLRPGRFEAVFEIPSPGMKGVEGALESLKCSYPLAPHHFRSCCSYGDPQVPQPE